MKAPDFDYYRPDTLSAALALLAEHGGEAQPLAGGQSLMPMMNFRIAAPEVLVDLGGIPDLRGITRDGDVLRIGAMTRYAELVALEGLSFDLPLVAAALPHVAHDAIRNRGTIGGSLSLADAAAEMPAVMLALGATLELAGPDGMREVAADDYFLGFYETARQEDELLVAVHVPCAAPGAVFGFHEIVRRQGDYAMAGVCIAARSAAPLAGLRIAFFGIADRALRVEALEAALEGTDGAPEAVTAALSALDEVEFSADHGVTVEMRRHLAGVALSRAMKETVG